MLAKKQIIPVTHKQISNVKHITESMLKPFIICSLSDQQDCIPLSLIAEISLKYAFIMRLYGAYIDHIIIFLQKYRLLQCRLDPRQRDH